MQKQGEKADSWHERGERPPVGCECEIHHEQWPNDDWEIVRIMAITEEYVIVKYHRCEQHYLLANMKFRPLRTEREDAMEEIIKAMIDTATAKLRNELTERMRSAGFRMEKPQ